MINNLADKQKRGDEMNKKLKFKIIEVFGSQAEFSMRVTEDESVISRVILGRRGLNMERQKEWAKILGCEPDDIFPSEGRQSL